MMSNPLISIIVPVYNAEKYLPRCLDSILNQTYKNLEVICIDDGSTDRSGEIIDNYKKIDSRIVYITQDNRGQGYTRWKGIQLSKGDFIALVDDDDYILPDMYKTMLDAIIKYNVDVCVCQWDYETVTGKHTISRDDIDESIYGYHTSIDFAHYLYKRHKATGYGYSNGVVVSPWNKLFKKDVISDIVFSGYIGEDEEMNDQVNCKNCRIYVIPEVFYYWCENRTSMSHQPFSEKRFHFLDMLENGDFYFFKILILFTKLKNYIVTCL